MADIPESISPRRGRPRLYDLMPRPGFGDYETAALTAVLDELSERALDLIADLDSEALAFVPGGTTNSIAMLIRHMAAAEAGWITRVTGTGVPNELETALAEGMQNASGVLPVSAGTAEELAVLCRRVRNEVTVTALCGLQTCDTAVTSGRMTLTAEGVLMHIIWHWTHHTGQVGLIRRLAGRKYAWVHSDRLTGIAR